MRRDVTVSDMEEDVVIKFRGATIIIFISFLRNSLQERNDLRLGYSSSFRGRTTIPAAPYQSKARVDRIKSRSIDNNAMPAMTSFLIYCLSLWRRKTSSVAFLSATKEEQDINFLK